MTGADAPPVAFSCREIPGSYFYELAVRLGDRCDEIGGSRVFVGPEDTLMRAALELLAGGWEARAPFPAENDDFVMRLKLLSTGGEVAKPRLERPCELVWSRLDGQGRAVETRSLGVAPSLLALAEAILAFGRSRYAEREPSAALVALAAALPAVRDAAPGD